MAGVNETKTNASSENENITRATLRELYETNENLNRRVAEIADEKKEWRQRNQSIKRSDLKLMILLRNLTTNCDALNEKIGEKSSSVLGKREWLTNHQLEDSIDLQDFYNKFGEQGKNYKNLLSSAYIEYRAENLERDVEKYNEVSSLVEKKIMKIDNEIKELTVNNGMDGLEINHDTETIQDIKKAMTSISDGADVLKMIRSNDNTLSELKRKINQKERAINNLEKKKKD